MACKSSQLAWLAGTILTRSCGAAADLARLVDIVRLATEGSVYDATRAGRSATDLGAVPRTTRVSPRTPARIAAGAGERCSTRETAFRSAVRAVDRKSTR